MKEAKLVKDIEKFVLDTLASGKYPGLRYNTHVPLRVNLSLIMKELSELKTLEGKGVAFTDEGVYEGQRVIRIYFP